jgi:hypothetical protein
VQTTFGDFGLKGQRKPLGVSGAFLCFPLPSAFRDMDVPSTEAARLAAMRPRATALVHEHATRNQDQQTLLGVSRSLVTRTRV